MILRQVQERTSTRQMPSSIGYVPVLAPTLDGEYTQYWQAVYQPGYTELENQVDYQTDLFSTGDGGKLLWTATTRSLDLTSANSVASDVTRRVVPEMQRDGVVVVRAR